MSYFGYCTRTNSTWLCVNFDLFVLYLEQLDFYLKDLPSPEGLITTQLTVRDGASLWNL